MATVQLIGIRRGVATVRRDQEPPVEMSWGDMHEAQQQPGDAGYVYRWLMGEYCRCEWEQRQGKTWESRARDVAGIVAELSAADAAEEAARAASACERVTRAERQRRIEALGWEGLRVEAERALTTADNPWWPVVVAELPRGLRFDTPRQNQGQIVEVSYGTFGRSEAGACDPYKCVLDRSTNELRFYRRRAVSPVAAR